MAAKGITPITVPQWGGTMLEGKVCSWNVDVGARVEVGDELVDVESDKIASGVESPGAGVLRRQIAETDEILPVGALLGIVADEDTPDSEIDAYIEEFNAQLSAQEKPGEEAKADEFQYVTVANQLICHVRQGDSGSPVLLVHGFGGDLGNWLFNLGELSKRHVVYALDLPGHGRSSKAVEAADPVAMANRVAEFMDEVDLAQAHVVGHSMGGAVAQQMAIAHRDRVSSLTLICSAGLGPEINGDYIESFVEARTRRELKRCMRMIFSDPAVVTRQLVADMLTYKRSDGADAALRAIANGFFDNGRQRHVLINDVPADIPVLAIFGSEDLVVPVTQSDALPNRVKISVFEGVGHMAQMESPSEVNSLLERWLLQSN